MVCGHRRVLGCRLGSAISTGWVAGANIGYRLSERACWYGVLKPSIKMAQMEVVLYAGINTHLLVRQWTEVTTYLSNGKFPLLPSP